MFKEIFENAAQKCAENNSRNENDYEKDGLLYCGLCDTPKQVGINVFGKTMTVFCDCHCQHKEYTHQQNILHEQEKSLTVNSLRNSGIHNRSMHNWTFANDNGSSPKLINTAKRYVNGWEEMRAKNIGLCLFGNVGTGKTYAAACIANALIDKGIRVIMTDFSRVINSMQSFDTKDKNGYIDDICSCDLLILDDLGAERQSDYSLQICEQVIDERAKNKKPLILTTNIPLETIKNPPDVKYARMYSRILEMTVPVQSAGSDKRSRTHEDNMKWAKEYFSGA